MTTTDATFEGWCIVELLGHRRLSGQAREVEMFGTKVLRLDVALPEGRSWPTFHASGALYGLTPTTMESISDVERRANQGRLVQYRLAPESERQDYESWERAESERRRLAWEAGDHRLLAEALDEEDELPL